MWRVGVLLVVFVCRCFATSACPDPNMRQAVVGGDSIRGIVFLDGKPLKSAAVKLYSRRGKYIAMTTTDGNGTFTLHKIAPGKYSLNVLGWGNASVHVSVKADRDFPQKPNWFISLLDNHCVGTGFSMD